MSISINMIFKPKTLMGLTLLKESSKYSQYQVVTFENKQIVLLDYTIHIMPSIPHWNAWEIDCNGFLTEINYYIKETNITGVVDIYDFLNIRVDIANRFAIDKTHIVPFTNHYYKLKLNHFLDNL